MPPSTSSTPISIPTSSPIAIRRRDSSSDDDDDSDSIGGGQHRTALNESDSIAELQVGSLPMHLRRTGRGTNSNSRTMRQYHRNNSSDQLHQFMGAMSLPPPRAPFISARQDIDSKLSSMPEISLPESAASTDPDLSSSLPFGSLRESQFTHPHLDRWQQRSNDSSSNQLTTTKFQPQSLPVYASTGSGGIGSFFPESNDVTLPERDRNMLNESSGIGGLLEGSRDGDNNNYYSRDIAGMTNQYNQLALDGSGIPHDGAQGNVTFDDGRPNGTNDDGNLSRSLTALDMLKRIRQTAPLAPPSQLERPEANVESRSNSNLTGLMEQQQQQNQYNAAQSLVDGNEQHYDHHADPDMFEAFDFELDG
mmetsp:Transcript_23814/g.39247  ORF Transcript_23814/g.39247 Transcript_23814/m.39247 type:complete len:364 (-) Transcript_23814:2076-3167(-)